MARVLATADLLAESHQNRLRAPTIRLALLLLFCCGLRRGELLRLRLQDFDSDEGLLRIEATKFHKSRLVPLSRSVHEEIRRYQQERKAVGVPCNPDSPLVWSDCGVNGKHTYCAPALAHNWRLLCLASDILDERGRPPRLHDLRHSFAVAALRRWYTKGCDAQNKLPLLATYMGHVSAASTHLYLHLTPELREAANWRFHRHGSAILDERGVK
jgi:integrase